MGGRGNIETLLGSGGGLIVMNSNRYHVIGLLVRLCLLLFTGSLMMSKGPAYVRSLWFLLFVFFCLLLVIPLFFGHPSLSCANLRILSI